MLLRPWLWLPPLWAHHMALCGLKLTQPWLKPKNYPWRPFQWRHLKFVNRMGMAGGIDKNAEAIHGFWSLGTGFIEVGTITPRAQQANPGPIMLRFNNKQALWNKMGFPNEGMDAVYARLLKLQRPYFTPLFVNIGKNRDTSNEMAAEDYLQIITKMQDVADAFVVNISSPNTKNLRDLLEPQVLAPFLKKLAEHKGKVPMLLKLSPDLTDDTLKTVLDISCAQNIDGWILTNTTAHREPNSPFPVEGGISGQPLATRSKEVLTRTIEHLGERRQDKLIVSVGGIMSARDAEERIEMGADLVAVYTALVYNGPSFFREVSRSG